MKLKQAIVLGLATVLALPAFAADNAMSQPSSVTMDQHAAAPVHTQNGALHVKKGQKAGTDATHMGNQTELSKLNTVNPEGTPAK